jgi:hypothetical protein
MALTLITVTVLAIVALIIILHKVLKSDDDVDLTVNLKRGEMSVKKKKNK